MKSNLTYIMVLICFLIGTPSCEISKYIDFDMPAFKPKYVLIGLVGDSSVHEIYFGRTIPPYTENQDSVQTACIKVLANNELLGEFERVDATTYKPKQTITINKDADLEFQVVAETQDGITVLNKPLKRPNRIRIDSLSVENSDIYFMSERNLKVYFTDPAEQNFYALRIDRIKNSDTIPVNAEPYEVFSPNEIFDDASFNGRTTLVTRKIKLNDQTDYSSNITLKVTLYSLTKETYMFFWTSGMNKGSINDYFNATIEVVSNIENGTGCIGAYRSHSMIVVENDF